MKITTLAMGRIAADECANKKIIEVDTSGDQVVFVFEDGARLFIWSSCDSAYVDFKLVGGEL